MLNATSGRAPSWPGGSVGGDLEIGCLAQLCFASKIQSFATIQRYSREAIALADRYGWGAEPIVAPALIALAGTMAWTGDFDEGDRWLERTARALQADTGPDIRLLVHITSGMLQACRGHHREALAEFSAAEYLGSQLADSHALAGRAEAAGRWPRRPGSGCQAKPAPASRRSRRSGPGLSGDFRNARAVICLAEGDPAGALSAVRPALDGTAPVIGDVTRVEAYLLAGLAHRELGDLRSANQSAERALAVAESERLVLPFAMTGAKELLEALPRHETAHSALLADILDVMRGSPPAGPPQSSSPLDEELTPGELRVLRYLPTSLSRPESQANCPSRRTRSTRTSAASTPSSMFVIGPRPCSARGSCRACWRPVARASPVVTGSR